VLWRRLPGKLRCLLRRVRLRLLRNRCLHRQLRLLMRLLRRRRVRLRRIVIRVLTKSCGAPWCVHQGALLV
jgi:hypothetical protein